MRKLISIDLVIPVYNEEKRLNRTFDSLNSFKCPSPLKINRIIFVNDGSKDSTLKLIRHTRIKFPKSVISYKRNQGKGFAVRKGMLDSSADYALLTDADISTPLSEIYKFIPFMKAGIDVVIGTRKNGKSTVVKHQPFIRENMGKVFTALSRLILGVNVTDFTCGFKAFKTGARQEIFKRAKIHRWGYDSEILFIAHKLGFNIVEKAVVWADQTNTKVKLLKDAIDSFKELIQIRYNYFSGKYRIIYGLGSTVYNMYS